MNNTSHTQDEILITDDVLARYKISRSTLYFWSTPPECRHTFLSRFRNRK